jgi:hypothetical protein
MLLALELGVAALALIVFLLGLGGRGRGSREIGLVTAVGLAGLYGLSLVIDARGPLFDGAFIVDGLAVFLKQVFLLATLLAVVGGLARPDAVERRRALEYHVLVLTALLGMMVLASAKELVLLFVAFELMSIPLYVLAGFVKRDARAVEASLKFFLVGSLSTAFLVYGLSFVYGVTGSTRLDVVTRAVGAGDPLLILGLFLVLGGVGFKIAAFPFHMWVPDTYEAAATPFVAWLSVAPKAAGFAVLLRVFIERAGPPAALWAGAAALLGALTIVAGNLMAIPQTDAKRLLAYSRSPTSVHAARGGGALGGGRGDAALLSGGVPVLEHGRLHGRGGRGPGRGLVRAPDLPGARPALAGARARDAPVPALAGRHPVRGGVLGQALHPLGARFRALVCPWARLAGPLSRAAARLGPPRSRPAVLTAARPGAHFFQRPST